MTTGLEKGSGPVAVGGAGFTESTVLANVYADSKGTGYATEQYSALRARPSGRPDRRKRCNELRDACEAAGPSSVRICPPRVVGWRKSVFTQRIFMPGRGPQQPVPVFFLCPRKNISPHNCRLSSRHNRSVASSAPDR